MSKKTRLLLIGLVIGLAGIAVTMGVGIGADMIMSREDSNTYYFEEPIHTLVLPKESERRPTVIGMMAGDYRVEAFIKAWRPEHIEIDDILCVEARDGVLYISMDPFPDDFLGMFPQPYELNIDVYTPKGVDIDMRYE